MFNPSKTKARASGFSALTTVAATYRLTVHVQDRTEKDTEFAMATVDVLHHSDNRTELRVDIRGLCAGLRRKRQICVGLRNRPVGVSSVLTGAIAGLELAFAGKESLSRRAGFDLCAVLATLASAEGDHVIARLAVNLHQQPDIQWRTALWVEGEAAWEMPLPGVPIYVRPCLLLNRALWQLQEALPAKSRPA